MIPVLPAELQQANLCAIIHMQKYTKACLDIALQMTMTMGMGSATTSGTAEDTTVTSTATTTEVEEQVQPLLLLEGGQLLQQLHLAKHNISKALLVLQVLVPVRTRMLCSPAVKQPALSMLCRLEVLIHTLHAV